MKAPNFLVFFTDQQRWDTTGIHGNPLGLTPNFDRVAQEGTFVQNAFTCQPVCGPARSSLQTGQYATSTGVFKNGIALKENAETLGKLFRNAGYKTGYIGKWHLAGLNPGFFGGQEPVPENKRGGYEYWLAAEATEYVSDAYNAVLFNEQNTKVKLPGYRVDAHADAAIRFIAENHQDPFFLFLSFIEPHHQNHTDNYPAPTGYEDRYINSWMPPDLSALGGTAHQHLPGYYGMVKRLDEAFGRVLDAIKSLGIENDTVILFMSDHGNHFKTRNDEYKRSCHESSIRIPVAFTGGEFLSGGTLPQLVSIVDIAPTLLDAAGIDIPESVQGHSILPLIRKQSTEWEDDVFIQVSEDQVGRCVRTHRWKYSVYAPKKNGKEFSDSQTYVEEFLYDLKADPYELTNLVGYESHRGVADKMKSRLLSRIKRIEGKNPQIENAPPVPTPRQRMVHEGEENL